MEQMPQPADGKYAADKQWLASTSSARILTWAVLFMPNKARPSPVVRGCAFGIGIEWGRCSGQSCRWTVKGFPKNSKRFNK